jgi:hypothetical protein
MKNIFIISICRIFRINFLSWRSHPRKWLKYFNGNIVSIGYLMLFLIVNIVNNNILYFRIYGATMCRTMLLNGRQCMST